MEQPLPAEPADAAIDDRQHVERLLGLYPDITPDQTREIMTFLRKGPILEGGLLDQNEALREKLAQFRKDNGANSAISSREWLVVALLVASIALVVFLLWDAGL